VSIGGCVTIAAGFARIGMVEQNRSLSRERR